MDLKTIFICLIVINIFMGLFTYLFKLIQKVYPGINFWIVSNFLIAAGYILIALRGKIPDVLSVITANFCFLSAGIIRIYGLKFFYNIKLKLFWNIFFTVFFIIFIIYYIYFTLIINSILYRSLFIAVYLVFVAMYSAIIILKNIPKEGKIISIVNGIFFIIFSLIFTARAIAWLIIPQSSNLFFSSLFNDLFFVSNLIMDILWTMMFLKMNNQRLAFELKEKNKELEEVNKMKDKLYAIIAHDLRNPFIGIIGISKLLLKKINENDISDFKDFVEMIKTSGEKNLDLLENLLNWAKSQTGIIKFNPEKINIQDKINKTIETLIHLFKFKNIKIEQSIDSAIDVFADKYMFDTIIRNILTNSIKYSYKNNIIKISAYKKDKDAIIEIEDFGIGITQDNLNKIFQIDKKITSGTDNEKGSGFGLIICEEFIKKNNGNIRVESEENKGSKFFISFKSFS